MWVNTIMHVSVGFVCVHCENNTTNKFSILTTECWLSNYFLLPVVTIDVNSFDYLNTAPNTPASNVTVHATDSKLKFEMSPSTTGR